jgi:Holliday junction resolvase RusA-like endonuclease
MQIIIEGKPIPKKRPRFAKRGKFVKVYSAQKKEEEATRLIIKSRMERQAIVGCSVDYYILLYADTKRNIKEENNRDDRKPNNTPHEEA